MQNAGFSKECKDTTTSCRVFKRYYFYSTIINKNSTLNTRLEDMIKQCNTLYICGHDPERDVMSNMAHPITFIGNTNTWYAVDEYNKEVGSVFYNINKHTNNNTINQWIAITETGMKYVDYNFFFNNSPCSFQDGVHVCPYSISS